jgi:DNA-binding PadR family transcriptional regulator
VTEITMRERHVLDLLGNEEAHGLDLVERSRRLTSWWAWVRLRPGSVYLLLDRMETKGLIISRAEHSPRSRGLPHNRGLPRRLYRARKPCRVIIL